MVGEYSDKKLEKILNRVHEWGYNFSKSSKFQKLTEEQKDNSRFIIESFTEYMYSYHDLIPEEWNEVDIEECCLDTLPRKISADDSYFKALSPVLSAFFSFLEEKDFLKNGYQLANRLRKITNQIVQEASDPRKWGMAKSLVMSATEAGVDVTNQKEMDKFVALLNLYQLSKTNNVFENRSKHKRRLKTKIGRNNPCLCGSGKKYKKCCGSIKK